MRIKIYDSSDKQIWDNFVDKSKNATFLIKRDYMDYHSDRFDDFSLIFTDDSGSIVSLLPAHRVNDTIVSHGGLTYGGLVMSDKTSAKDPLMIFELIKSSLPEMGISSLIYKPIPWIYHVHRSEEDLYALFRNNARLTIRNLATVIDMKNPIPSSRLGKRALKRQRQSNIAVRQVSSAESFWDIIVEDRRVRHNVKPVHTLEEINLLRNFFPENIIFLEAYTPAGEILAGAVLYMDHGVIHLQYAAATPLGKDLYATDVIYHDIIFNRYPEYNFFDFGISNENNGQYLNTGMTDHKEEFGGRSVVYDTYSMKLSADQ